MSQQLNPINNGVVPEVQTTVVEQKLNVLSEQYVQIYNLKSRPTEWNPVGRPIYRRLPGTSERYQVDFFNFVAESNVLSSNKTLEGIEKVGYVYIPYGENINGPTSSEVISSQGNKVILVKAGNILWEYGKTEVLPTLIDLKVLEVLSGTYTLAYQLVYDDSPIPKQYSMEDFSLSGQPMEILASTDSITGWRFSAVNAFIFDSAVSWSNEDSFFPSYAQPVDAYLQWKTTYSQAYTKVTLRCPSGTAYSGTATLSYVDGTSLTPVETVSVSKDSASQFFEFVIDSPESQIEWNVSFSSPKVSIQSVLVSGALTLLEPQAAPSPRASLVMYPANALPQSVENTQGELVPATYCLLANVDVNSTYEIEYIEDLRTIIHRDYLPVADWLTKPFDSDLVNLYDQVSTYSTSWMNPDECMKQEYVGLEKYQINVEAK
jgi:hypothetical protein